MTPNNIVAVGGRYVSWCEGDTIYWKYMPRFSDWKSMTPLPSLEYICGHCGLNVASIVGFVCTQYADLNYGECSAYIYICPRCHRPTLDLDREPLIPGSKPGKNIGHLSDEVKTLHNEVRSSIQAGAFTGAVMICRTLIGHIAKEKVGAKKEDSFEKNIDDLLAKHFIPEGGKDWVTHIRKMGNAAVHKLRVFDQKEAEQILTFTEMLLVTIYEFPESLPKPPATP